MLNKRTIIAFMTAIALTAGAAVVPAAAAGPDVNATITGLALRGYDPVAYFTDGKPIPGDYKITARYNDATYRFASQEHKALFEANPAKYLPQYGGFCAFGAAQDVKVDGVRPFGRLSTTSSISTSLRPYTIAGTQTFPAMSSLPTTIGRASRTRRSSNPRWLIAGGGVPAARTPGPA
jgi:YHS domain-containing protein